MGLLIATSGGLSAFYHVRHTPKDEATRRILQSLAFGSIGIALIIIYDVRLWSSQ